MQAAIGVLQGPFLAPEQVAASFSIMGLDTQLIEDGTYFVAECDGRIAGCGGWSRRATLFGGDHSQGRDASLLDPAQDAARVRAMYTHPDFVRRGVGRLILSLCEAAAAHDGFARVELAATLAGRPLYLACGYCDLEEFESQTPSGVRVPLAHGQENHQRRELEPMRLPGLFVGLFAALSAGLFACHPSARADAGVLPRIEIASCRLGNAVARCGTFFVPENWSNPGGRVLRLHLIVIPSLKTPAREPVFFLVGGPGQAATGSCPLTWCRSGLRS
jgi:GNAT superfamily N-acetyltransferase